MKQTTCRNLRGACDAVITGETAEAMGAASKQIKKEWFQIEIEMAKNSLDTLLTEYYLPKSRITL